jgi:uncharacterized protein YbjT (DUF2867 family)
MILITGSAGKTGRSIIRALRNCGEPLRALVHHDEQVAWLGETGVSEIMVGDMRVQDCLDRAVQGVRAIYHIPPNVHPDEVNIGKAVMQSARSAQVEHIVFHSVLHPQIEAMPHHWKKMQVEAILMESELDFTILQPAVYMQNLLSQWDDILHSGIFRQPFAPETRLCMVDLEDVAQAAMIVLTEAGHRGATYELVGTSAISQTEISKILSDLLNRPMEVLEISLETWERNARAAGLGEYQVETLIKMFRHYDRFGFSGSSSGMGCLLRRQPTSFVDFVKRIKSERQHDSRTNQLS